MASIPGGRAGRVIAIGIAAAVAISLLAAAVLSPAVSAQTVADIEERDQLIANQEALLNVYRCRFGIDTQIVEDGCVDGRPIQQASVPGMFAGSPTHQEVGVRDDLIADQEALLNAYRCRFGIDTEIVPVGCVDGAPAPPWLVAVNEALTALDAAISARAEAWARGRELMLGLTEALTGSSISSYQPTPRTENCPSDQSILDCIASEMTVPPERRLGGCAVRVSQVTYCLTTSADPAIAAALTELGGAIEGYNAVYESCASFAVRRDHAGLFACQDRIGRQTGGQDVWLGFRGRSPLDEQLLFTIEASPLPSVQAALARIEQAGAQLRVGSGYNSGTGWFYGTIDVDLDFDVPVLRERAFEALDLVRSFGVNSLDNAWARAFIVRNDGLFRVRQHRWDSVGPVRAAEAAREILTSHGIGLPSAQESA